MFGLKKEAKKMSPPAAVNRHFYDEIGLNSTLRGLHLDRGSDLDVPDTQCSLSVRAWFQKYDV